MKCMLFIPDTLSYFTWNACFTGHCSIKPQTKPIMCTPKLWSGTPGLPTKDICTKVPIVPHPNQPTPQKRKRTNKDTRTAHRHLPSRHLPPLYTRRDSPEANHSSCHLLLFLVTSEFPSQIPRAAPVRSPVLPAHHISRGSAPLLESLAKTPAVTSCYCSDLSRADWSREEVLPFLILRVVLDCFAGGKVRSVLLILQSLFLFYYSFIYCISLHRSRWMIFTALPLGERRRPPFEPRPPPSSPHPRFHAGRHHLPAPATCRYSNTRLHPCRAPHHLHNFSPFSSIFLYRDSRAIYFPPYACGC
jgi:hypothetical protein